MHKLDACKAIALSMAASVTKKLWEIDGIVDVLEEGRKLARRFANEKYGGDYSRRICGDGCLRLLVRCHGFME